MYIRFMTTHVLVHPIIVCIPFESVIGNQPCIIMCDFQVNILSQNVLKQHTFVKRQSNERTKERTKKNFFVPDTKLSNQMVKTQYILKEHNEQWTNCIYLQLHKMMINSITSRYCTLKLISILFNFVWLVIVQLVQIQWIQILAPKNVYRTNWTAHQ